MRYLLAALVLVAVFSYCPPHRASLLAHSLPRAAPASHSVVRGPQEKATALDAAYFTLVSRDRTGDFRASAETAGWSERDLRRVSERLRKLPIRPASNAPDEGSGRFRAAAIMLHTDAALDAVSDDGTAWMVDLDIAHRLMVGDGSDRPLGTYDTALDVFTPRNWLLAVTQSLTRLRGYDVARGLFAPKAGADPYRALLEGTDQEMLLAAGSLEEGAAFIEGQDRENVAIVERYASSPATSPMGMMARERQVAPEGVTVARARQRAEKLYRRAVEVAPALHEARLRLGRVLFERGASGDSAGELQRVLAESRNVRQRYLAALFLGAVHEREGRLDAAIGSYALALSAQPDSQSARVALASVMQRKGDAAAARDTIAPFAGRRTNQRQPEDPWWTYPLGQAEEGRVGLERLRAAVVRK